MAKRSDDVGRSLRGLGVPEQAIEVYRAIVQQSPVNVSTVAYETDIPKRRVFELADSLEAFGLLTVKENRSPSYIRAHSVDGIVEQFRSTLNDLRSDLEAYEADGTSRSSLREHLEWLNLDGSQRDGYLALLDRDETSDEELADAIGVSRSRASDVARSLAHRGFADRDAASAAATTRPVAPAELVGHLEEHVARLATALEDHWSPKRTAVGQFEVITSTPTLTKQLREGISEAKREIVLTVPAPVFPQIADELANAVDHGVFTLVAVTMAEDVPADVSHLANAVRTIDRSTFVQLCTDQNRFAVLSPDQMVLDWENQDQKAIVVRDHHVIYPLRMFFLCNTWPMGREVYVDDRVALPRTFENFFYAVFQAARHWQADNPLRVTVEARPTGGAGGTFERITGTLVEPLQGLLNPRTNEVPSQCGLRIRTGDDTVTVGARGASLEDYEARLTTLEQG